MMMMINDHLVYDLPRHPFVLQKNTTPVSYYVVFMTTHNMAIRSMFVQIVIFVLFFWKPIAS